MRKTLLQVGVVALAVAASGCVPRATARPAAGPQPGTTPPGATAEARGAGAAGRDGGEPAPKPYDKVITDKAITREGMFKAHRMGSKLYFEIPRAEFGKDILLVTTIKKNTLGGGYGGDAISNRVLRWEKRPDNRVLLRTVEYDLIAEDSLPIYQAVEAANYAPVVAIFPVEAFGPDSAAVVEVSKLFTSSSPEFGVGNRIRGSLDKERSFIEEVRAFPRNVNVEATHTYTVQPPPMPGVPEQFRPAPTTASVLMHWSMVKLPDVPMQPRLHDSRVGYFSVAKQDFGSTEHRVTRPRYITRWRLECPAGQSIPCEPAQPIVYYVDPATPAQWVPWVKRGIEDWQRAFEEAGFRNAIVARDAPSPAADPDWSPEDARFSVVRWLPSTIENAQGPHVHDPRTGEILESDIRMYHNVLNLLRDWYFVQAGPLDPRARTLPLPDTLMGRLLQYVVAHEVGHTLGFPHNQKASATYPADSLRNVSFLRRMGHTPTLMDYARFNYVVQPEDNVPPELLVPDIGPYDKFATMWGYRPIPGARTPEAEERVLDQWIRQQDTKPYLRFMTSGTEGADPGDQTEAVGDADPVYSTRLGVRNLQRVMTMLLPAAVSPTRDYADLKELYARTVAQWATELSHVATLVGGVDSQEKRGGQPGVIYEPVSPARQRAAMRFLSEAAFRTPEFFLDPEVLRRIEVDGAIERIGDAQGRVVSRLLDDNRMKRLIEFEALASGAEPVYTIGEMLGDLRRGIWTELYGGPVRIDAFRRNLQREYLDVVNAKLNPRPESNTVIITPFGPIDRGSRAVDTDARAMLRGELAALDEQLRRSIPRAGDRSTRLHLEDARIQIDRILDPNQSASRE